MTGTVEIAVVGASVRGTALVERLIASAPELLDGSPLRITVFDPHPPGSGRIWRDGQPQTLIMNTVAAQSTVFTDDTVRIDGPITPGPNLAQWCALVAADPSAADLPADVAAEAAQTRDDSSPSRLLYGHYLRWCFRRITGNAPEQVTVRTVAESIVDISPAGGDTEWTLTTSSGDRFAADAVILAVGWLPRSDTPSHPGVVAPGNPIDQDLSQIAPGSTVVVRGLGMGFFDTVSLLTETRGGVFTGDGYRPSGQEPQIIAGSRRGLPYRAKPVFGAPPFFPEQRILRAALSELHERRPVDFTHDVLPLIHRDALYDYYAALARVRPDTVSAPAELLAALVAGSDDLDALVAAHVADPADRLDLADAADPLRRALAGRSHADIDALVAEFVRHDAAEAALGADSPLKLGLHSYAAARGAVIDLVAYGGLTAASFPAYRAFLATAASFGSGPPLRRSQQLLALHDAGIVRFAGPGLAATLDADGVRVTAHRLDGDVRADALVEAWLPTPTVEHTADPLLRRLIDRGYARAWRHADGTPTDALDVRHSDSALIGSDGRTVPGVYSVGVPHEDIRVFTIIAPVPGTNSPVLREIDAAARSALVFARSVRHAERTPA